MIGELCRFGGGRGCPHSFGAACRAAGGGRGALGWAGLETQSRWGWWVLAGKWVFRRSVGRREMGVADGLMG